MSLRSTTRPHSVQRKSNETAWALERYSQKCRPSRYSPTGMPGSSEKKEVRAAVVAALDDEVAAAHVGHDPAVEADVHGGGAVTAKEADLDTAIRVRASGLTWLDKKTRLGEDDASGA